MIDNRRGILAMSASVVVFIFNDALIKLAAESIPAAQVVGLRGIFASLWCGLALLATGGWRQVHGIASPPVFWRGVLEAAAALTYLTALAHTPFAIATAVNLSTPLFLTVLAILILKEAVRWRRWTATILGFVGVLMVIQPHPGDINAWTWVVVFSSLIGAIRDILGRYVPARVPVGVMSLWSSAAVGIAGLVVTAVEGWHPMGWHELGLLVAASLLLAMGYQFLMVSLRSGAELSVTGSFRYGSVLWALGIGYVVWGDVPNLLALSGIVVIVAAGVYILHRERVRGVPPTPPGAAV
ncbi:MAG: DMT family transporter [Alphaproteobacteria bacterium]|nr:DMT family transporter [Alphaproteobacteria bacterium]